MGETLAIVFLLFKNPGMEPVGMILPSPLKVHLYCMFKK